MDVAEKQILLTTLDRSNYFKGLLLLIGKDQKVTDSEKYLLMGAGKVLGFEKNFCNNAISELLENTYLSEDAPVFSQKVIAQCFIKDGMKIALSDTDMNPNELEWLKDVADVNGIEFDQFSESLKSYVKENNFEEPDQSLEVKLYL